MAYIFNFKSLKYLKFIRFRMLPVAKIIKKTYQQYTIKHLRLNAISPIFMLRDRDLHFRFQIFKFCKIRSFSYVAGS